MSEEAGRAPKGGILKNLGMPREELLGPQRQLSGHQMGDPRGGGMEKEKERKKERKNESGKRSVSQYVLPPKTSRVILYALIHILLHI